MMKRTHCREQLQLLLAQELRSATGLLAALAEEHTALCGMEPGALDAAGAKKQRHLEALETLERERETLSAAFEFKPDQAGFERLLDWCGAGHGIAAQWRELLEVIEECEAANIANGAVVNLQRRQIEQALSIMQGQFSGAPTYEASGEAGNQAALRVIGKA